MSIGLINIVLYLVYKSDYIYIYIYMYIYIADYVELAIVIVPILFALKILHLVFVVLYELLCGLL